MKSWVDLRVGYDGGTHCVRMLFDNTEFPKEGDMLRLEIQGRMRDIVVIKRWPTMADANGKIITSIDCAITDEELTSNPVPVSISLHPLPDAKAEIAMVASDNSGRTWMKR